MVCDDRLLMVSDLEDAKTKKMVLLEQEVKRKQKQAEKDIESKKAVIEAQLDSSHSEQAWVPLILFFNFTRKSNIMLVSDSQLLLQTWHVRPKTTLINST